MIAAQIASPKEAHILDTEVPGLKSNEVLIEVKRAGICGTDLHIWHGSYGLARYPLVPGHEFSGVVSSVGDAVETIKPGDRVTVDPNLPCYHCSFCQQKQFNQCLNLEAVGVTRPGAFAGYVSVPQSAVYAIGDMDFAEAALVEPLACVVWGLKQVEVQPGDSVLIMGAGPMGILMMQAVLRSGAASVVMVDKEKSRLELAQSLGASRTLTADTLNAKNYRDVAPHGFDIVADATGIPAVITSTFAHVKPGGKVWVFGVAPTGAESTFMPYDVFRYDLKIIGSFAINKTFHEAIAMVKGGAVRLDSLVSHSLPLSDFEAGLDLAENDPNRMKVQFEIGV